MMVEVNALTLRLFKEPDTRLGAHESLMMASLLVRSSEDFDGVTIV